MSPKAKRELAREHLETAREDLDAGREKDAINALFYAAEAAAVALAEAHGIDTQKHHGLKADAVTELHEKHVIDVDYGPTLKRLNQARKDIWYEGDEPDLGEPLGNVLDEVERLVREAEAAQ